ncbi:hypothetical protein GCM10017771_59820 [Streptomyces capitiformicae]|uniref:Uncharacterized protein n=1 Tax=Streptomyces capitiformicae TaxID=2014920 RepID=A0A918Z885_9ACTN|nr:hypothetical protein GCM10017771_59820 [Streptomyces capitiformicae]
MLRSAPGLAVLIGVARSAPGLAVLIGVAYALGRRAHDGPGPFLGAVGVEWNPMSHTATAVRDLFGAQGGEPGHAWAAIAWPLALLAVLFPLAVRRFARLSK